MQPQYVMTRLALTLALTLSFFGGAPAARAEESSDVLLELVPTEGPAIDLTRAQLEALPQVSFETKTGWTEGSALYSGPRLSEVLALAGLQGKPVEATAANDYKVVLTPDLIGPDYPIVALKINDKPFNLRELGPLWVIYPYDSSADFRSERVFSASIWQVVRFAPAKD
jgi:hypothetical protein